MADPDSAFTGTLPAIYDRYLGPLLFAPFARDLARRAQALNPRDVLETAAGTGIVTRALSDALPNARITATDLNGPMTALGASLSRAGNVRWSVADALALPFPEASFDLAVCQFGVMFFPDRHRAFAEVRRVLKAGGVFLCNVWDDLAHNDVARIVAQAVTDMFPGDPPTFIGRVPHGHAQPRSIEGELAGAGFSDTDWEAVDVRSSGVSVRDAAVGWCEGTPLRHEIVQRDERKLPAVIDAAAAALRAAFGGDEVAGKLRAFVFSARKTAV